MFSCILEEGMKRKILVILGVLVFLSFLSSCTFWSKMGVSQNPWSRLAPHYYTVKYNYRNEIRLVDNILENPADIQNIIESSEFYDTNITEFHFLDIENSNADIYGEYIEWLINFQPIKYKYSRIDLIRHNWNNQNYKNCKVITLVHASATPIYWWRLSQKTHFFFCKEADEYRLLGIVIQGITL
jgi:hypothetical protein